MTSSSPPLPHKRRRVEFTVPKPRHIFVGSDPPSLEKISDLRSGDFIAWEEKGSTSVCVQCDSILLKSKKIVFTCPFCWTRYKKPGKSGDMIPTDKATRATHRMDLDGDGKHGGQGYRLPRCFYVRRFREMQAFGAAMTAGPFPTSEYFFFYPVITENTIVRKDNKKKEKKKE